VIGASGAVATVLGAYAVTWPWARVHTLVFLFIFVTIIDLPALLVLGAWFIGQVLSGTRGLAPGAAANVAWWAHIGGFLAGMLLMPVFGSWVHPDRPPGPRGPTGPRRPFEPDWDNPSHDPQWPRDRIIDVRLKDD
jgi:membrane associated rhomboid family serine protease